MCWGRSWKMCSGFVCVLLVLLGVLFLFLFLPLRCKQWISVLCVNMLVLHCGGVCNNHSVKAYISEALDHSSTIPAKCAAYIDFQKQKVHLIPFQRATSVACCFEMLKVYLLQEVALRLTYFHAPFFFSPLHWGILSIKGKHIFFQLFLDAWKMKLVVSLYLYSNSNVLNKELFHSAMTMLHLLSSWAISCTLHLPLRITAVASPRSL